MHSIKRSLRVVNVPVCGAGSTESRAPSFRVKAMEAVPSLEFSREELPGVEGAER